ncbi:DUF3298 domain-containing protein [Pseudobutyrivibrio xylanivorans]|uniref:DUF3298 domain-containing protein n=1 Tax=Pseudobutyrivibrio xylanivorans TaxID=185007 RepID=A0A5P6VPK2_PSEXY|nr:DUF3298 domain-containing protein [Pseudobutyrivibrio xylanivorans]QFJ54596.1 DUF3298 domain-containing protein [Pseudobutyrivibrio xylanivorans]
MKKKIIAGLLIFASSFSILGCSATQNSFGDEKVSDSKIGVTVVNHPLEVKQDGKLLAHGSYPEILISEEYAKAYPNLKNTLDEENQMRQESSEEMISDFGRYALESGDENTDDYNEDITVDIVRADDIMFSYVLSDSYYSGNEHPVHYTNTCNIDVKTGHTMNLKEVITDKNQVASMIKDKVYEKYPENKEEIENYYVCYCAGGDGDVFTDKMNDNSYSWILTDEGIHIYFSAYELASYETGEMDIMLTKDEISNLVQDLFRPESQDLDSIVKFETADMTELQPSEPSGEEDDYYTYDEPVGLTVANPTFHRYVSDKAKPAAEKHITLTETSKDKSDWLDTSVWAEKNGFEEAFLSYGDGNYYYAPGAGGEWGYEYTTLFLYDYETNELLRTYDLSVLCNGPDEEEEHSSSSQYIHWAKAMDGVLYVSLGHNGYASEEPWSSYVVAIDMSSDKVLWRSEPLVSNASNFQIVDDTIICGYGFTAEPDYLYLLDKNTGEKVEQIKVESGPEQIEVVGDTLYVATYNTAYTYKINR